LSGWGSWAGEGAPPPRSFGRPPPLKKGRKRRKTVEKVVVREQPKNVLINPERSNSNSTYMLGSVPHPFASRAQYEKTMAGAIGSEWNVSTAVKQLTMPRVLTRAGCIIQPLTKKTKSKKMIEKRAPAKF